MKQKPTSNPQIGSDIELAKVESGGLEKQGWVVDEHASDTDDTNVTYCWIQGTSAS